MKTNRFEYNQYWANVSIPNISGNFNYGEIYNGSNSYYPQLTTPFTYDKYWLERFRSLEALKDDLILFECLIKHCDGEIHVRNNGFADCIIAHKVVKLLSHMA